ncbi:MAG: hypothetical protein ACI9ES_003009 [Oceanospirillaceae bacterium]|jgi:hypothetical protein
MRADQSSFMYLFAIQKLWLYLQGNFLRILLFPLQLFFTALCLIKRINFYHLNLPVKAMLATLCSAIEY